MKQVKQVKKVKHTALYLLPNDDKKEKYLASAVRIRRDPEQTNVKIMGISTLEKVSVCTLQSTMTYEDLTLRSQVIILKIFNIVITKKYASLTKIVRK
jgi:hypothetical protein